MAETIEGGATLAADGKTWRDANGNVLPKDKIAEIERVQAERDAQRAEQERAAVELNAQRDPVARALLQQQAQQAATRTSAKAKE
jgi:hypothetical protein